MQCASKGTCYVYTILYAITVMIMCLLCACTDITCYACYVPTYHITFNTVAGNATCILFAFLYVPAGIMECCIVLRVRGMNTCLYMHEAQPYTPKKRKHDNLNNSDNLGPSNVKTKRENVKI